MRSSTALYLPRVGRSTHTSPPKLRTSPDDRAIASCLNLEAGNGRPVLLSGSSVSIQGGTARRGQGARSRAYPEGT